ncbi:cytochrome P450 [Aeromicrobium sp. Leaf350]|uniref:cytochrome P450 n=1 Tax=Aeromicrobium sp. Leaf350 TaxID=2876565 RepID=UPI001E4FFC8E|nr:cytochrome P450 [Aeromicrobium sp. Leaf350]
MSTETEFDLPTNVPPSLVRDLDMYRLPGWESDPQLGWTEFSKGGEPIVYSPHNGGHWVATVPEDILGIYRDHKNWSNFDISAPKHPGPRMPPLESDPPLHSFYRKSIQQLFTPMALREIEPLIRQLSVSYIEEFLPKGRCEYVTEFGLPLPITVFLGIMGMPIEDGSRLNSYLNGALTSTEMDEKMGYFAQIAEYVHGHVEDRIADPRADGLTRITESQVQGRPMTPEEAKAIATMTTQGGLDSVGMLLSFITLHLAENPDDRAYVANHLDDLDHVVAELSRRYFIPNEMRTVPTDREFHGVTLKAGDLIAVNPAQYNFNEELFPDPAKVDFSRPKQTHITFGAGAHACPGANLATLEVKIFLQEWLSRIPEFEVDPDRPAPVKRCAQLHGISDLNLRWPTA